MPGLFLIATAHPDYKKQEFPQGSVVIDPRRMIPDQEGVSVKRIGENKPELISVLVPSRARPRWFQRMINSAYQTATYPRRVEYVVWHDEDDDTSLGYYLFDPAYEYVRHLMGPRMLLSECWNACAAAARGEILMHCGDDLTFDTPGWDEMVRRAFRESEDKILFVHGDDLGPHGQTFGTHGFVHRRWVDAVGYFLPPLFSSDWNDVWLNEVAEMLGRRVLLPFVTEHHHYTFGKSERDITHAEREARGERDGVVDLYKRTAKERKMDAQKLRSVMM